MANNDDEVMTMSLPPPLSNAMPGEDMINLLPQTTYKYIDDVLAKLFDDHQMDRLGGASGKGWSSFSTMQRCAYLFKVKYIDKIRAPAGMALELGSAFHTFLALHYRWMRDETLTLTPYVAKEGLLNGGCRPQPIIEAWRLYESYAIHYQDDYLTPIDEEVLAIDPDGNSCRYDAIAEVIKPFPGVIPGVYIIEHKSLILHEKIKTPTGWRYMGDLKVGETISDPDGGIASVMGVYPQGVVDLFEVKLRNGKTVKCSADHLWLTRARLGGQAGIEQVLSLKDMQANPKLGWELPELVDGKIEFVPIEVVATTARGEAQCIKVMSQRSLFMLDNGIITHNTAARFSSDFFNGWRNDGEILGQIMVWKRANLDEKYGQLRGTIVNIVGKQKVTQFHRVIVPAERWHVQQHMEDLKVWSALQRMYEATNTWPRSRANCQTKFGSCELHDSCSENRAPISVEAMIERSNLIRASQQEVIMPGISTGETLALMSGEPEVIDAATEVEVAPSEPEVIEAPIEAVEAPIATPEVPIKRKRGRPRKHPLPVVGQQTVAAPTEISSRRTSLKEKTIGTVDDPAQDLLHAENTIATSTDSGSGSIDDSPNLGKV